MTTARQEWRQSWPLPFLGMLGITGVASFTYG
ncbi:MAG: hypothetical protein RL367_2338, partial [Pseudomonadota bacterium]